MSAPFPVTPFLAANIIEIFERCGHWLQQERPEDTNRVLLEFLRGLD